MKRKRLLLVASVLAVLQLLAGSAIGQVSFTGSYTEDFDAYVSLATLPTGWATGGTGSFQGTGTGTGTAGGFYSFHPSSATSDNALGALRSGSATGYYEVTFTNNTGSTITTLDISYDFEQYKSVNTSGWAVLVNGSSNAALSVSGVSSGITTGTPAVTNKSTTVTGLSISNGNTFKIRWTVTDASGSDNPIAVDNFSMTSCVTPTAYSVTGTGAYCSGGSGITMGVSNSQSGVTYQLYRGATTIGSPVSGIGSSISFPAQTVAGTYSVLATRTSGGCTAAMTGTAVVSVNALPTVQTVSGGGSYCTGGAGVPIGLGGSQSGISYQLYNGASVSGSAVSGSGSSISFGNRTAAGIYTVVGTNTLTACTSDMSGSATVSVDPLPTISVTPAGGPSCIDMTASGADTYIWSPATGLSATTGTDVNASPIVTTTYTVTGTSAEGCVNTTTVTVTPGSVAVSRTSPAAAGVPQGTANHLLQTFNLAVTSAEVTISGLTVTTAGSYSATDVTALDCWFSNSPTFSVGTSTLVSTIASPGVAGVKVFSSFVSEFINSGSTGYLHITADVSGSAVGGRTISLSSTSFSNFGICAATFTGTDPVAASSVQTITATPCSGMPAAGVVSPATDVICGSGTSILTLTGGAAGSGLTYQWSSSATNTPPGSPISGATSDVYTTATVSATTFYWCTTTCSVSALSATSATGTVSVNPVPASTGATNSGPICEGGTVTLSSNSSDATAWLWDGPDGFSSTSENPVASPTVTGTYSLTVSSTGAGCDPGTIYTTIVSVNPVPSSTGITNDGPVCVGGTVTLSSNSSDATSWSWSGPGAFTSTLQNPTLSPTATGTYSLTVATVGSGCSPAATYTSVVTVNPVPSSSGAGNNGPICTGNNVTLAANSSNATSWSWSGPDGFTSTLQNPVTAPTATATYSLTVAASGAGCSPATVYTTSVVVNTTPTVTVTPPGGTSGVALTASGATTYSWSPSSGLSTSVGASVTATPTVSTTYTVTGTSLGCTGTATVDVDFPGGTVGWNFTTGSATASSSSNPNVPTSGSIASIGNTLGSVTAIGSTSASSGYSGSTGGNNIGNAAATGAFSSGSSPYINFIITPNSGYCLTITGMSFGTRSTGTGPQAFTVTTDIDGFGVSVGSGTIANNSSWSLKTPTLTSVSGDPGTAINLRVYGHSGTGSPGSSTINWRMDDIAVSYTANPAATLASASNGGAICAGGSLSLFANTPANVATYSWVGPNSFSSSVQNPTIATATAAASGTYTVTVDNGTGCTSTYTTTVTVNPAPTSTGITGGGAVCVGGSATLHANSSNANQWTWSGSDGFTSSLQNPGVTPVSTTTYSLTLNNTVTGCSSVTVYTTTITVNPVPSSTGATNGGPICVGGSTTLSANSSDATAWSWNGPDGFTSALQNPTASPTVTGTYSLTVSSTGSGCAPATVYTTSVTVNPVPSSTGATNGGPICVGGSTTLSANSSVATAWSWNGPDGFASALQNPTASPTVTGTYSLTVSSTGSGCAPATVYTTSITVNPVPSSTGATNGGPICVGGSATLSANSSDATAWSWNGPDGFTSALQNPTASPTVTGTYSLTVSSTGSGCAPATVYTTSVTVNPVPSSTGATNGGPICVGSSTTLSANSSDATAWSWNGPDGFTSALQNPTTSPTVTGTYSLTVSSTGSGCAPATVYTTSITINPVPSSTGATNGGSICVGGSTTLSANSSDATAWSWNGPDGFTSVLQNPTTSPTVTGTYSLTVSSTGSGCAPATVYTTSVTVNPVPSSTGATNGGPICVGGSTTLSANTSDATAWSWNGPDGFTSALQNPTASPTVTGTYSLTVSSTGSGCAPATVYTTTITVNPVPSSTGATNGGPICVGGSTTLSANSSDATAWSWNGPDGFTSALQNPTASPTVTGTYSLTLSSTGSGCAPATVYTTSVTVNPVPSSTGATNGGPICVGGSTTLSANSSDATAWSWNGPDGFTSALQNPTASPTVTGTYSLTVSSTGSGCAPATVYTTSVTVNPVPSSTGATNGGPICVGGSTTLSANSSDATAWSWNGPDGFTSALQNPTASPTVTGTYSLTVGSTGSGCAPATVYTTTVTVNPVPSSTGATNGGPICVGGSTTLSANSSDATAWSWNGPDGFTSVLQNPTASPTVTGTYSLTVSSTGSGCAPATVYTTSVTVNTVPLSTGATNGGPICVGGSTTLSANSSDATAWSWNGPDGFTSALQNPTASPTVTGTYSLTVSSTGSGCVPATVYTTSVTVNPVPSSTGATNGGPICVGGSTILSANSSDATAWSWNGPDGFTSALQSPTASPTVTGTYSLTVSSTGSGCAPATVYTTTVTVNPVPSSTGATNGGPICVGGSTTLSANSSDATTWSWNGPDGFTSALQNPTASPTVTGTYSLTVSSTGSGCAPATVYTTSVTVNPVPSSTGATNGGPICVGGSTTLSANSSDATAWSWNGPDGFTSALQNPTASPTVTGTYSLTVSSTGSGCAPATVYTTTITVNPVPSSIGVTNGSPICVGGSTTLSANSSDATAWSWNGPDGFTSALQNPTASPTVTGTYSLTVSSTGSGCAPATVYTTSVTVNPVPSSTGATNGGPICVGGSTTLSANSSDATAWSWNGPDGFTSALQNPTASPTVTGTYSLTVSSTGSGCAPATVYTTSVTVNPVPSSTGATNGGPICVGGSTTLSANSSDATAWSWNGPDGFTSALQNPTASPTVTGTYSLTMSSTGSGCAPATVYTTTITVNPVPSSTGATNGGPICVGGSTTLSANSSDATAWSWNGPDGFTSALQNPTASPTVTGTYSLTVSSTGSGCAPATVYTTTITVNPVPSSTGATNGGPICVGGSTTLSSNSSDATAWSWNGPDGFTSALQNPTVSPTVTGTYSLTVSSTGSGCAPATVYTTSVTVNPVPSSTGATNGGPICGGGSTTLSANSSDATAWSWNGPDGFTSALQNPTASPTVTGTYSLTVSSTGSGCAPATVYTTTITVNPVPSSTGATNGGPICVGGSTTLSANSSDATAWSWNGPDGFTSALQNPTASPTVTGTYSLTVGSTGSGCAPATVYTTTVTVNPVPSSTGATNGGPICVGGSTTLSANSSDATAWSWVGPDGFASALQNPTAAPTVTGTYSLTVSSTGSGCAPATVYTTIITVNPVPSSTGATNGGPICVGGSTTLSANSSDATAWSWNGPDGFTSALQNPTASPTVTGTYSLTVSSTGSGCAPATVYTTSVTVNPVPSSTGATNGGPICVGGSTTLSANSSDATAWSWNGPDGFTSALQNPTASPTVTGTYSLTVSSTGSGCAPATVYTTSVTVNPVPSSTGATNGGPICVGGSTTLSANSSDATAWSWNGPDGFTSALQNPTASPTVTGTYSLTVSSTGSGCAPATVYTTSVTVNLVPSSTGATNGGPICIGGSTTLLANSSDATAWSWNGPDGFTSALQNPTASPTVTGTYSLTVSSTGSGCAPATVYTTSVTVNPVPSSTGATNGVPICVGGSTTLSANTSDATAWSWNGPDGFTSALQNPTASPTVTGTYSLTVSSTGSGCAPATVYTTSVTVNPVPDAITGGSVVCVGAQLTLTSSGTGSWSSTNAANATIGSGTGVVTGIASGSTTIIYTLASGCNTSTIITVNASPIVATISGTLNVCAGATTTLSNATSGGAWSSANLSVASVGTSGIVSGISAGTATIKYGVTNGFGCLTEVSAIVTVNAVPVIVSVTGPTNICMGTTASFSSSATGGVWSSSNLTVATIDAAGLLTPVSAGAASITYSVTNGFGCTTEVVTFVTVNSTPTVAAITGTLNACSGVTNTLINTTTGGEWSSGNVSVASIGSSSGDVLGVNAGTSIITYTVTNVSGCTASVSAVVTVNAVPMSGNIAGATSQCVNGTAMFTISGVTGGNWSSSNSAVATVNTSGLVTAIAQGVASINYTTGCGTATRDITVNPRPSMSSIGNDGPVCAGNTINLSGAASGGIGTLSYLWHGPLSFSSTNANPVLTGSLTATSGIYTLTVTDVNGCTATGVNTTSVSINPLPAVIGGNPNICIGFTTNLSNTVGSGIWSSDNSTIASVDAGGVVAGNVLGNTVITYTLPSGCYRTTGVTVNPFPEPIVGDSLIYCIGTSVSMTSGTTGGNWTSGDNSVAVVNATSGVVTSTGPGIAVISYTAGSVCARTVEVTVNPVMNANVGVPSICLGQPVSVAILTNDAPGGTWSSSNPAKAVVSPSSGVVKGKAAGTTVITYMMNPSCYRTTVVTVNPAVTSITGYLNVCPGISSFLSNATTGGTWSSSDTTRAVIDMTTGAVTGMSAGAVVITYKVSSGCYKTTSLVVPSGPAAITGTDTMCVGAMVTWSSAPGGGTWTSGDASVAAVNITSGVVTGVGAGTAEISYRLSSGCYTIHVVTVNNTVSTITGTANVCPGGNVTLMNSVIGGTWSSSNPANASIDAVSGIVTGINGGTSTITYMVSAGCYKTTVQSVNPLPAAITGATSVCEGSTTSFTSGPSGGVWVSSDGTKATVSASGVVAGVAAGTATITYQSAAGCLVTKDISVNMVPSAISGPTNVCLGDNVTLNCTPAGGVWSSSNTVKASIDASGVVTPLSSGVTTISYVLPTGCYKTVNVSINTVPVAISGAHILCQGATTPLSNATSGGIWVSSNSAIATIGATGIVKGIAAGNVTISYQKSSGCFVQHDITINPVPAISASASSVCIASQTGFTGTPIGGTWSSSNTWLASIDATTGVATGVNAGAAYITYTLATGCYKVSSLLVNALPSGIGGISTICQGTSAVLSSATSGGSWISGDPGVATINATGVVTGIGAGSTLISYQAATGCVVTRVQSVTAMPTAITGTGVICAGYLTTLNSTPSGGTWTSNNPAKATIDAAGVVTGVSAGNADITYSTGSAGCISIYQVTVNGLPSPIYGALAVCNGNNSSLIVSPGGGLWSSDNASVASVSSTSGVMTGNGPGNANITYTMPGGCYSTTAVTVNPGPLANTGSGVLCMGQPVAVSVLSNAETGGTWSTGNAGVVVISPSSGVMVARGVGTANISYTTGSGCYSVSVVTVNPPVSAVAGPSMVCTGNTALLTNTTTGGTWSSSNVTKATIDAATGVAYGLNVGTSIMTYMVTPGCYKTSNISISVSPAPISGATSVTVGAATTLTSTTIGGTWKSSDVSKATVNLSTGLVSGVAAGSVYITYKFTSGCYVTYNMAVISAKTGGVTTTVQGVSEFTMVPNPTSGLLNVMSGVDGILTVLAIDGKTECQFKIAQGENRLHLPASLSAGFYMCRFSGVDGTVNIVKLVYQP